MLKRSMYRFERDDLKLSRPHAFVERRAISFQDIDAAGIIFYPRVLALFHDVYVGFLAFAGCPLPEVLKSRAWLAPVRHAEADYFKPLRFGDEVTVEICRAHLSSESEATLGYRIARAEGGEVCAVGQVVHTFVDASFKRTPMPEPVRRALEHLESAVS